MRRPCVLIARAIFPDLVEGLRQHCEVDDNPQDQVLTPQQLRERLQGKQGVLTTPGDRIDADLLDAHPQLRIVANMAVGFNNLDVAACSARGVLCTNTPDVLTETTADFGFGLMLAAARRVSEAERFLRRGEWTRWSYDMFLSPDVHHSTLGVLGMGRIGQAIARRAHHGFGMQVIYHNRSRLAEPDERAVGARHVDLPTLLRECDHLVIVVPYSPATHHLIGAAELALMKPTATLTNIARGGVVDDAALAEVLAEGRLAAAGLDVFEGEPQVHPLLLKVPNVVLTPHIASASVATRRAMAQRACDNLLAGLGIGPNAGRPPDLLNPEVLRGS